MKKSNGNMILMMLLFLALIGCGGSQNSPPSSQSGQEPLQANEELAEQIEVKTNELEQVDESVAVVVENDIFVGMKVSGFARFRLKQIREKVHNQIKEMAPSDYEIHVTSDKRLFAELQEVNNKIQQAGGVASPQVQSELTKINEDMQG